MKAHLTQRQEQFCTHYVTNGFNARQAALDAGYSYNYACVKAHQLVNHPLVKERIDSASQKAETSLGMTFEWKLSKLQEIIEAHSGAPHSPQSAKVVIAAISEVNKMTGEYAPHKRISLTVDATKAKLEETRKLYEPRQYADY